MAENSWSITDSPLLPVQFETPAAEKTWSIVDSPLTLTQFESAPAEWANNDWLVGLGMVQAAEAGGVVFVEGSLATTESADVFSGSGSVLSSGAFATTESADVFSGSGTLLIYGEVVAVEAYDTFAASGDVLGAAAGESMFIIRYRRRRRQ